MVGKSSSEGATLIKWPWKDGASITPDRVWSYYVHMNKLRQLLEIELSFCGQRIHNQRIEINRLLTENAALKKLSAADAEPDL